MLPPEKIDPLLNTFDKPHLNTFNKDLDSLEASAQLAPIAVPDALNLIREIDSLALIERMLQANCTDTDLQPYQEQATKEPRTT